MVGVEIGVLVGDSREADAGIELLALERPELESVVILSSQCTDTTLWRLIRHHPKIKEVRLCGSYITGKYLKHLDATRSSVVEILDLSRCERLTDDGLICLLSKTGGTLRVLNVGYTNISLADLDPNLESMTRSSSVLEELNLGITSIKKESAKEKTRRYFLSHCVLTELIKKSVLLKS